MIMTMVFLLPFLILSITLCTSHAFIQKKIQKPLLYSMKTVYFPSKLMLTSISSDIVTKTTPSHSSTFPTTVTSCLLSNNRDSKLFSSSISFTNSNTKTFDPKAFFTYMIAIISQTSLQSAFLYGIQRFIFDKILMLKLTKGISSKLSHAIAIAIFVFLSLRSRVFSPLNNARPKASLEDKVFKDRLRPTWQPPPIAFPIIWTTIGILRTVSCVAIYSSTKSVFNRAIFAYITHLSISDTWNTINNVENRLGTSVVGVFFVWLSLAYTLSEFYTIKPMAAYILFPSFVWISIASYLIYSIWKLNYEKFDRPTLYPSKEEGSNQSPWRIPLLKWNT